MGITLYDVISNMLWATINTYTYMVLVFIFYWNKKKYFQRRYTVLYISLSFAAELIHRFFLLKFPSSFFLFSTLDPLIILLQIFLIVTFFDTKFWKSVALVLFYSGGYSLSYLLMAKLLSIRTAFAFGEGSSFYTRLMHEMSLLAVVVLFLYIIVLLLGIARRAKNPPKTSPVYAVCILLPSCLYIIGYFIIFPYMMEIENKNFPFVIGTIMFALNIIALMLIVDADKKNMHLYYLDKQYQEQEHYFARIKESNFAIQKRAHDERKHLAYVTGLLQQGEYKKSEEYLLSLNKRYVAFSDLVITGNFDIDTILNAKIAEAQEAGCHIAVAGQLPGNLGIDSVDFCILIGNCLDNALVACLKTNARQIKVNFTYYKQVLFIRVENPHIPTKRLPSVNDEIAGRFAPKGGLGLAIMTAVARKHGGHLKIMREGNTFITEIVLRAPLETGPETAPEK